MEPADIRKLFEKFGTSLDNNDVWKVQQATVLKHKALERLAASAGIKFDAPTIIRAERDEAVILATGWLEGKSEWSIGEALIDMNYRVSGKQAGYVYAMAEKRAKDRVILKLAGLHGLYSEDEADEFKESSSAPQQGRSAAPASPSASARPVGAANLSEAYSAFLKTMKMSRSKAELREWFFANKDSIAEHLPENESLLLVGERNTLALSLPEHVEEAA